MSYSIIAFGYAFSKMIILLLLTETISVFAEIVVGPILNVKISEISPKGYESRYFSVYQLEWTIGGIIGPIFSALILNYFNGVVSFVLLGIILIIATAGWRIYFTKEKKANEK